jgi:hypothetical protein
MNLAKEVKRLLDSFMVTPRRRHTFVRSSLVQLASHLAIEPAVHETHRIVEMLVPLVEDLRKREVRAHDAACRSRLTARIASD